MALRAGNLKAGSEDRLQVRIALQKRPTWFLVMIVIFGLIWILSLAPLALHVAGRSQGTQQAYYSALDRMRDWKGTPLVFALFTAANLGLLTWYLKSRRGLLVAESGRIFVGKTEIPLHAAAVRLAKWEFVHAGVFGSLLIFGDQSGGFWRLGLKNILLAEDRYTDPPSWLCDGYVEDEASGRNLLAKLSFPADAVLDLGAARISRFESTSAEPLDLRLIPSAFSAKVFVPIFAGLFGGAMLVSGTAFFLVKVVGAPDRLVSGLCFVLLMGMILANAIYGTKLYNRRDLRLKIDGSGVTLIEGRKGEKRLADSLDGLTFDYASWWTTSRYTGKVYVGPVLVLAGKDGRRLKFGAYDRQLSWTGAVMEVTGVDYVLGPPDWMQMARRLGVGDRLSQAPEQAENPADFS